MTLIILFYLVSFLHLFPCSIAACQKDEPELGYVELSSHIKADSSPENESVFDAPVQQPLTTPAEHFITFWDWKFACSFKKIRSPLTQELFVQELNAFAAHFKNSSIINKDLWVQPTDGDAQMPSMKFLLNNSFEPYVIKLEVDPEEKTVFIGDIHGDIDSFNLFIESLVEHGITHPVDPFKVIDPKANIIFLGDYSDRGEWGLEVLYALSRFIRVNSVPGAIPKVFGIRGNHEDPSINFTMPTNNLYIELTRKFNNINVITLIEKFYNCLPLALFLKSGGNALLACHGGIEPGFRDTQTLLNSTGKLRYILINKLYRKYMLKKLPLPFHFSFEELKENGELKDFDPCSNADNIHLTDFGFLWSDYNFENNPYNYASIEYHKGRGMRFPEQLSKAWFTLNSTPSCQLIGNIRGHQHSSDTMKRILNKDGKSDPEEAGLAKIWLPEDQQQPPQKLWPGIVCTLCVCPNTFCILTTGQKLDDWKLKVHHMGITP
jgi:Calcineurin-like phosphoesterase